MVLAIAGAGYWWATRAQAPFLGGSESSYPIRVVTLPAQAEGDIPWTLFQARMDPTWVVNLELRADFVVGSIQDSAGKQIVGFAVGRHLGNQDAGMRTRATQWTDPKCELVWSTQTWPGLQRSRECLIRLADGSDGITVHGWYFHQTRIEAHRADQVLASLDFPPRVRLRAKVAALRSRLMEAGMPVAWPDGNEGTLEVEGCPILEVRQDGKVRLKVDYQTLPESAQLQSEPDEVGWSLWTISQWRTGVPLVPWLGVAWHQAQRSPREVRR